MNNQALYSTFFQLFRSVHGHIGADQRGNGWVCAVLLLQNVVWRLAITKTVNTTDINCLAYILSWLVFCVVSAE